MEQMTYYPWIELLPRKWKWDVFVSYSRRDKRAADAIIEDLIKAGFNVWKDDTRVFAGERLRESINRAIENSATVLMILSAHSLKSRWVLNELDAAMLREINERRIVVLPLLIGRINPSHLPADLSGKRFLDCRGQFWSRYKLLREELCETVATAAIPGFVGERGIARNIPVGPLSVQYFLRREFKGSNGNAVEQAVHFAELIFETLLKHPMRGGAQEFVNRHGRLAAVAIILREVDTRPLDVNGFTEKEFGDVLLMSEFIMDLHEKAAVEDDARGRWLMGIAEDGELAFQFKKSEPDVNG